MSTTMRAINNFINQTALDSMAQNRAKLATISDQISKGEIAEIYTDLVGVSSVEGLLSNKEMLGEVESKLRNNKDLASKLTEMETVLNSFSEMIVRSKNLCYRMMDPTSSASLDGKGLTKTLLGEIKFLLNTSYQGEKLFAGGKTDVTDVVGDIENTSNIIAAVPSANYYNGDGVKLSYKISQDKTLEYGITADDPVFQTFIAAHHYMLSGTFNLAVDMLNQTKTELGFLIAKLGTNSAAVSDQIDIYDAQHTSLMVDIANVEETDIMEKMMELSAIQLQLQASFSVVSKLSNLSLVNYLR